MALGSWAEWGRKIVDQLESQERSIRELEKAVSSLVVKVAIAGMVGSTIVSIVVAYLLNRVLN